MDAILMDYAADPQIGLIREEKLTSIKATHLSTWTCTHSPIKVSYSVGVGIRHVVSIMVGNTKLIPIGEDIDSTLILVTLEEEIKSRQYFGNTVKQRHNQTIERSWP